jgi:hypothetical protein
VGRGRPSLPVRRPRRARQPCRADGLAPPRPRPDTDPEGPLMTVIPKGARCPSKLARGDAGSDIGTVAFVASDQSEVVRLFQELEFGPHHRQARHAPGRRPGGAVRDAGAGLRGPGTNWVRVATRCWSVVVTVHEPCRSRTWRILRQVVSAPPFYGAMRRGTSCSPVRRDWPRCTDSASPRRAPGAHELPSPPRTRPSSSVCRVASWRTAMGRRPAAGDARQLTGSSADAVPTPLTAVAAWTSAEFRFGCERRPTM